jgi:hypothetical protein
MRYRTTVSPPWLAALPQRSAPMISAKESVGDLSMFGQYRSPGLLTAPHSHRDPVTVAPNAALGRDRGIDSFVCTMACA